jgi:ankyrin repeat protein
LRHSLLDVAVAGDVKAVEKRLGAGVDPDVEDPAGEASLHDAAKLCRPELAELLLSRGADPNARDAEGNTSLHRAAANCRYDLAQLLVQHGADSNARNNQDKTPADLLNCPGKMRVFKRLLAAGAGP